MADNFAKRIRRNHAQALVLAQARANGCTCDPDIDVPSLGPGTVRVVTIKHDNDCPHYKHSQGIGHLADRINAGEFDA